MNIEIKSLNHANITRKENTMKTETITSAHPTDAELLSTDTINQLDALRTSAREAFGAHHTNLYSILGKCYELYYAINTSERAVKKHLTEQVEEHYQRSSTQLSTTLHTQIVRLVFADCGLDRRTVSRYASTLRHAFQSKRGREQFADSESRIQPDKFATWISLYGIDNAQRDNSNSSNYTVEDALRDMSSLYNMGVIDWSVLGTQLENKEFEYKIIIARWDATINKMVMCKVVEDENKVKALISPMRKQIEADYNSKQVEDRRKQVAQSLETALAAASKEAA